MPVTVGRWLVQEGHEGEFVTRWAELAEWTEAEGLGTAGAWRLLRDPEHPDVFVSVENWRNVEAIDRWRDAPGVAERLARLEELVRHHERVTLQVVAEVS